MLPENYNGFYVSTDIRIGSYSVQTEQPSNMQLENANNIKSFFTDKNWTLQAICGILGNMQAESTINPAFIQGTNRYRLPNSGATLSDVPNEVMKNFYKEYYNTLERQYGLGLVQWDGYSTSNGERQQKLVAYAIRNNYNWFDGWCQVYRLYGEYQKDSQYHFFYPTTIGGTTYTFDNYVSSHSSPTVLAEAWQRGYERNAGGLGFRGINAEWWYSYFTDVNPPPIFPIQPDPADPDIPIPVDPEYPLPDGADFVPAWFFFITRKRKELKPRCLKI